ncbi:MAG: radical SAM family heme chaperone HemW [Smithellaceae bacterium]|nr:radical SAM family heme chaperone HemW [Smithellaceae bacterium]
MHTKMAGLYIHVPFCLSKCRYCSFYSVTSSELLDEFVEAVPREITFYKDTFSSFDTVYFGGGTPSLLTIRQVETILEAAHKHLNLSPQAEITMEVNSGDVSLEYFQSLHKLGINRLNIGVQSFDDSLLKFLGRRHTAKQATESIATARTAGFANLGFDLIYGVHGQNLKTWRQTLKKTLSFFPEHLSCYQLSLDRKTPLYRQYKQEDIGLTPDDEALDFFITTSKVLTKAGYIHYEVSNFARTHHFESRHNKKYWNHKPYLGLGPAAHSFSNNRRWWNKADVKTYLKDIGSGKKPVVKSEKLSTEQMALEALFLGMRTADGVDLKSFRKLYGLDLLTGKKRIIEALIDNKLVDLKNNRLCPTLAGMAVADSLALI